MKTLKQLREERGYTCKDVAEAVGITEPYYWYIENGKRRPYYDLVVKIANFFDVKLDNIKIFTLNLTFC
ncbi:helix-turn-helix transcriptional regulator [Bacillus sp. TH22]|uniref:helix-turn-helix domain-containing protein n=1 Tax=Bacillus sp. TH22 TaxID=2796388 RepID=UPI00191380BE|nr:helix-turn-helix transcriptional regulator [Bacillus sp. TH22]MBK5447457.1 helix-turn-helix transcriptional regulator [Bacillus sp. TH22]